MLLYAYEMAELFGAAYRISFHPSVPPIHRGGERDHLFHEPGQSRVCGTPHLRPGGGPRRRVVAGFHLPFCPTADESAISCLLAAPPLSICDSTGECLGRVSFFHLLFAW